MLFGETAGEQVGLFDDLDAKEESEQLAEAARQREIEEEEAAKKKEEEVKEQKAEVNLNLSQGNKNDKVKANTSEK